MYKDTIVYIHSMNVCRESKFTSIHE